ncbi:MAG: hypothetical protein FWC87_08920 [Acidimicrobiaceae bacterium]|nr:hypothetical protein [Acidimicrobiaceae bacterium]
MRRRSWPQTHPAAHAAPPGNDVLSALPARVISTMSRRRTRTPPHRSNQRCRRAKITIDAACTAQAAISHSQFGWSRRAKP